MLGEGAAAVDRAVVADIEQLPVPAAERQRLADDVELDPPPGKVHDLRHRLDEALRQTFKPEFLNRIDDIIYFNPLGESEIVRIIDLQVEQLKKTLAEKKIRIEIEPSAKKLLFQRGYDPSFGARPLRRAIQTLIQDPLALKLLDGEILAGDTVSVDADGASVDINWGADTSPPSTPSSLTATLTSPTSSRLSWGASTDNRGVTGYRVSRGGTVLATVTTTSYTDTGLVPGTYGYSVVALDGAGNALIWDVDGRKIGRTVPSGANGSAWRLAISPDGKTAAVGWAPKADEETARDDPDPRDLPQPRVSLVALDGSASPRVLVAPHGYIGGLAFSPDGRLIAFGGAGAVHLFELAK